MGLNHHTGDPIDPQMEGIFDNYSVKRQIINSGYVCTSERSNIFFLALEGNLFFGKKKSLLKRQLCSTSNEQTLSADIKVNKDNAM